MVKLKIIMVVLAMFPGERQTFNVVIELPQWHTLEDCEQAGEPDIPAGAISFGVTCVAVPMAAVL